MMRTSIHNRRDATTRYQQEWRKGSSISSARSSRSQQQWYSCGVSETRRVPPSLACGLFTKRARENELRWRRRHGRRRVDAPEPMMCGAGGRTLCLLVVCAMTAERHTRNRSPLFNRTRHTRAAACSLAVVRRFPRAQVDAAMQRRRLPFGERPLLATGAGLKEARLSTRLLVLPKEELAKLACAALLQPGYLATAEHMLATITALPEWAVSGVLLSPDLVASILAHLG